MRGLCRFARRLELRQDARAHGYQNLKRAHDQRRKQEFARIGLTLAAEAEQDVRGHVAFGGELTSPNGDIGCRVVAAAQLTPRVDPTGDSERRRVQIRPLQLVFKRSDRALGIVLLYRQPDRSSRQFSGGVGKPSSGAHWPSASRKATR